jgi:hypothetical protein
MDSLKTVRGAVLAVASLLVIVFLATAFTQDIARHVFPYLSKAAKGNPVLVYAAAKFMSQADLTRRGITFCQLPYSIHRVLGEAPDAP